MIYDLSQSYEIAFLAAGASSIVATCLLFLVPLFMTVEEDVADMCPRAKTVRSRESLKTLLESCSSPDSAAADPKPDAFLSPNSNLNWSQKTGALRGSTYMERYLDMPKRASMGSMIALSYVPVPPKRERLIVVDRVSQV